jgi:hypothetical protein
MGPMILFRGAPRRHPRRAQGCRFFAVWPPSLRFCRTAASIAVVVLALRTGNAAASGAPDAAYADAVRGVFDAPEAARLVFETLHEQFPDDDDVAWWLAELALRDGQMESAARLVADRRGRRVPAWQFGWSRARAWRAADPVAARAEVEWAVGALERDARPEDIRALRSFAAALAWEAADWEGARAHVAAVPGGVAGDLRIVPLARPLPADLRVEVGGAAWRVTRAGLVGPAGSPLPPPEERREPGREAGGVREGPGPDLVDPAGRACLSPGIRADVSRGADGWIYVAIDAAEGPGIHTLASCGARPRMLVRGQGISSPAWVDGLPGAPDPAVVWVEAGALRWKGAPERPLSEAPAAAPVVRVAAGPPGLLVVRWGTAGPNLAFTAAIGRALEPVFEGELAVTRATWWTAPRGE